MVLRRLLTFKQAAEVLGFTSEDSIEEIAGTAELPVVEIVGRGKRPNKRIEAEALEAFVLRMRRGGELVTADIARIRQADRAAFAKAKAEGVEGRDELIAAEEVDAADVRDRPARERRARRGGAQ